MADVVTYCKSGQPILEGGVVFGVNGLNRTSYYGPTGIYNETATQTYTRIDQKYDARFDDPRYYTGDAAT